MFGVLRSAWYVCDPLLALATCLLSKSQRSPEIEIFLGLPNLLRTAYPYAVYPIELRKAELKLCAATRCPPAPISAVLGSGVPAWQHSTNGIQTRGQLSEALALALAVFRSDPKIAAQRRAGPTGRPSPGPIEAVHNGAKQLAACLARLTLHQPLKFTTFANELLAAPVLCSRIKFHVLCLQIANIEGIPGWS